MLLIITKTIATLVLSYLLVLSQAFAQNSPEDVGWFPRPMQTMDEVFALHEWGVREIDKKFSQANFEKFMEQVNLDKVVMEHPELGKVEYKSIDGHPVVRLVHKPSGRAFMFLDGTKISKESEHLRQYVSRQHLFSGLRDQVKSKDPGRDVVLFWFQPEIAVERGSANIRSQITEIDNSPRPTTRMNKVKEYWQSIYKKPTRDTVMFGLGAAVLQTGVGLGVSALKVAFDPTAPFLMSPAVLNFLFGSIVGAYASTYRNWVYETSRSTLATTLKASTVSALYAYSLVYMTQGGLSALSIMDGAGLLLNAKIMTNIMLNNWGKVEWTNWARIKTFERVDNKVYDVKVPFMKDKVKVRERDINYQIYSYLPPQFLRTADLVGLAVALPFFGFSVPVGTVALWTSIPIVKYATLRWAEKYHPEAAKELALREKWEDFKRLPLTFPAKSYRQTLKIIQLTPDLFVKGKDGVQAWMHKIAGTPASLEKDVRVDVSTKQQAETAWREIFAELSPEKLNPSRVGNRCQFLFIR